MDYTAVSNRAIVTKGTVRKSIKSSPEAQARRKYITSHNFSIQRDKKTGEVIVNISDRKD